MINKKVILHWALSSLILITVIHYLDGWLEIDDWFGFILGIFFGLLLLIIFSIILAVIIASFPFNNNKTPGKEKIRRHIPSSTIIVTAFSLILFVLTRPSYANEAPEEGRLCKNVREGKFQLDEYLIERNGGTHTETNINTKEKSTYKVEWVTECEFQLTNVDDMADVTKIKIISVTVDAYECVASFKGRTTKNKISILENGN